MKESLLSLLRCPQEHSELTITDVERADGEIKSGTLACGVCGATYVIKDFVPRFVPLSNYADSFAYQRMQHARLQMDKYNGTTIQRDTILSRSRWPEDFLRGRTLLECGCGAGPDTQVLLDLGAIVTSVDISIGADFCRDNNYPNERLNVMQASIMNLPLKEESYDVVYCHRVIQHTPDPEATFKEIVRYLKPGGTLFLHSYPKSFRHVLQWKYWMRPLTKRMKPETLHKFISWYAPFLHPIVGVLDRNRWTRQIHFHLLPYRNYRRIFPQLSEQQLLEYGIHDTFDALAPAYDLPSSVATITRWLKEAGFSEFTFNQTKPIVVVAKKPVSGGKDTQ